MSFWGQSGNPQPFTALNMCMCVWEWDRAQEGNRNDRRGRKLGGCWCITRGRLSLLIPYHFSTFQSLTAICQSNYFKGFSHICSRWLWEMKVTCLAMWWDETILWSHLCRSWKLLTAVVCEHIRLHFPSMTSNISHTQTYKHMRNCPYRSTLPGSEYCRISTGL